MCRFLAYLFVLTTLIYSHSLCAQTTTNAPFSKPIETKEGLVVADVEEFASIPEFQGYPARMMLLLDEPHTSRLFVNDMYGLIYSVSYDGSEVQPYLDLNDPQWDIQVQFSGRERGFQSFAFHPDFGREGAEGYGRFYTFSDVKNAPRPPDFRPGGGNNTHHTVLHEWTAMDPYANTYDGDNPRELMRFVQPFSNHNAGLIAFNPLAEPNDDEYGLLYVGSADGGSTGDPLNLAQNLRSPYGKILRIDPLGSNSQNEQYGIPEENPFTEREDAMGEIYAYGVRNPQRFGWDPKTGKLFVADIGQGIVESVSLVPKGGNLGWNTWEGSFRFINRGEVSIRDPRSDADVVYPLVEFGQFDPLVLSRVAVTGIHVYRSGPISQLRNKVLFGDMVSGEIFYFDADSLPDGGLDGIRRILLQDDNEEPKTYAELIQEKIIKQGRDPSPITDLRFGSGPDDQVFLLNKKDGTIRLLVPGN